MSKAIPHIAIEFPDYFPDDFKNLLTEGIENEKLDLIIYRKEPTVWAASEWIVPGIIAVYILKPYFEAFLREAGKDHYSLLKKKLNQILEKTKDMDVKTVTSSGTTEKLNEDNTQSKAVSIFLQTRNGIMIKLLYDNDLDLNTWQKSTESILEMIDDHYNKNSNNELTEYLKNLDGARVKTIYAIIDPKSKNWTLISSLSKYKLEKYRKNGLYN